MHSRPGPGDEENPDESRQPLLAMHASVDRSEAHALPGTAGPATDKAQEQPQEDARAVPAPEPTTQQPQEHLLQPPTPALQAPSPQYAAPVPHHESAWPQGAVMWGTPHPRSMQDEAAAYGLLAAAMGMPSIPTQWAVLRPFLACWLLSSVINLMIFMMVDGATTAFLFAEIAAIIGIVAGGRAIIPGCQEGVDILTMAKQLHVMGALATLMDFFTLLMTDAVLLTLAFNCPDGQQDVCDMAKPAAAFFTFVLGSHALLSMHAARSAFTMIRMLNPITSGQLSLD